MNKGVIYVAYGELARNAAVKSIVFFRRYNDYPIACISHKPLQDDVQHIQFPDKDLGARIAKLNLNLLTPFNQTLYLDADTVPYQNLSHGFDILDDGFDFVITPSAKQDRDFLWHCNEEDREDTQLPYWSTPLVLQAGVFYLAKNERTDLMFDIWRTEWEAHHNQDQGALLRALHKVPLKVWLLGRCWNGGAVVGHRYGKARRR